MHWTQIYDPLVIGGFLRWLPPSPLSSCSGCLPV